MEKRGKREELSGGSIGHRRANGSIANKRTTNKANDSCVWSCWMMRRERRNAEMEVRELREGREKERQTDSQKVSSLSPSLASAHCTVRLTRSDAVLLLVGGEALWLPTNPPHTHTHTQRSTTTSLHIPHPWCTPRTSSSVVLLSAASLPPSVPYGSAPLSSGVSLAFFNFFTLPSAARLQVALLYRAQTLRSVHVPRRRPSFLTASQSGQRLRPRSRFPSVRAVRRCPALSLCPLPWPRRRRRARPW